MRRWLNTAQAVEFTQLSRHTLREQSIAHPQILMARPTENCQRRYVTLLLAQVVLGMSEQAALELIDR